MSWKLLLAMVVGVLLHASCGERFVDGSYITDRETGLNWRVGPDRDMTWDQANAWVDGLGGNWRMPTGAELRGLWDAGVWHRDWGPFENSGIGVWSGEVRDSSSALAFYFERAFYSRSYNFGGRWYLRSNPPDLRAFAVCSPQ